MVKQNVVNISEMSRECFYMKMKENVQENCRENPVS